MMTFTTNILFMAVILSTLCSVQAVSAGDASPTGGCPKGYYCKNKLAGGEWCTGHHECLSGYCTQGVGCNFTSTDYGQRGCSVDDDCEDGMKCSVRVCYIPDFAEEKDTEIITATVAPTNIGTTITPTTTNSEQKQVHNGLSAGAVAGIVVASLLVFVVALVGFKAAACKNSAATIVTKEQPVKEDGVVTIAGSEVGDFQP